MQVAQFHIQKERILSLIKMKGPSLPVQIAKGIGVEPLFAGAFLSELYGEKKIKISNTRVGSSPLYYLEGQEKMLENFIEHLNFREKEAFLLLKQSGILDDELQTPVVRVALRAIKDFAIPFRFRIKEDIKLFWRFFNLTEDEAQLRLKALLSPQVTEQKAEIEIKREDIKPLELTVGVKEAEVAQQSGEIDKKIEELAKDKIKTKKKSVKKEQKKTKAVEEGLSKKIISYLSGKDIEILESILDKKKEFIGKVRLDIPFGKQDFYLVAKDKKKVNEIDLIVALQNAQALRMPALILSSGSLHKKAEEYLKGWENLIRFEKIKL